MSTCPKGPHPQGTVCVMCPPPKLGVSPVQWALSHGQLRHYQSPVYSPAPYGDTHEWYLQQSLRGSGHDRLQIDVYWIHDLDVFQIQIYCHACGRHWHQSIAGGQIDSAPDQKAVVRRYIDNLCHWVWRERCQSVEEVQLLAEYITERLAEAGPAGVPYLELIRGVVSNVDAPGGDVARMVDDLGFPRRLENGKTMLYLPLGHVMRTW